MLTAAQLADRCIAFVDELEHAGRTSRSAIGGTRPASPAPPADALEALRALTDALNEAWWVKAAAAFDALLPLAAAGRTPTGRRGLARVGARVAWESAGHSLLWSELSSDRRDELAAAFERGLGAILSTSGR